MNSTSFGESSISNFFGIISPLILKRIFKRNILVIYHNSVLTNDVEKLGYNSLYDKLRKSVLKYLETSIFKHIQTFVTLQIYKDMIDQKIKNNRVLAIKIKYIEAIPTILLNQLENKNINVSCKNKIDKPIILLYGYWGPQKDLEFALNTLSKIREEGCEFYLIISGGINNHFKDYKKKYLELIEKYKIIINEIKGFINEKDIVNLFISVDLLLLSYNSSGGSSGVLNQAIFFEVPTIGIEFPEYVEQAKDQKNVILVKREDFKDAVKDFIIKFKPVQSKTINVKEKINESIKNVNEIIKHTDRYL
jgi:glycosyltransferase involved in cell wall biosynthesis